MTPEQKASMPAVKHPQEDAMRENLERVTRTLNMTRAMRALRWWTEWPPGHAEAPFPPQHVRDFQAEFGALPDSANRMLENGKATR